MKKIFISTILFFFLAGNVYAWFWEEKYLAKVNDEIIELEDFQRRVDELHRQSSMQKEQKMPSEIDLDNILDEMVDSYLLCQEGFKVGLNKEDEFIKKINSYLAFQSILRLRKEEIKDKIKVKDDDIEDFYKKHYMQTIGEDKSSIPELKQVEKKIRNMVYKTKEKERENEYLSMLKQKAGIEINNELLESLKTENKNREEIIAHINGKPVTIQDLEKEYGKPLTTNGKGGTAITERKNLERTLNGLIDYLLVKGDAINHNYAQKYPSFGKMINQYRVILMVNLFKKMIIYPRVKITENELREYYETSKDKFKKKDQVRLLTIQTKEKDEAFSLYEELKQGADFNRLARLLDKDSGNINETKSSWHILDALPAEIKTEVQKIKPGEISGVIEAVPYYKIIRLVEQKEGEQKKFSDIKEMLRNSLGRKKFQLLLKEYLLSAREHSSIKINESLLKNYKKKVKNAL